MGLSRFPDPKQPKLRKSWSTAKPLTTAAAGETFEPIITPGTAGQYWRGDKTWQTLDKSAVGLGNVDNTSDTNKPVSTAQQTALDLKLNISAYTAADVLAKLVTVDGSGSGLDADTVDGHDTSYFLARANHTGTQLASTISDFSAAADARISAAIGVTVQAYDAELAALAAVTSAADKLFYFTGSGTGALLSFSATNRAALSNLSGTNSGDQTTIVGITGTKTQFNTACTDGDFLYVGDITQYTDEMAQDAIGAMVDSSLVYVDATPLLTRAALSGDVSASQGSNTLTLATVNSNVGPFGSATQVGTFTVDGKGRITAASNTTVTPAFASITGKPTTLSGYGITDAQPLDSDLTTIAGLTATTDNFIVSVSSAWASRTPAQVRTTLGLVVGTNVQAWDADLDALAALTGTNTIYYRSAANTWSSVSIGNLLSFSAGSLNIGSTTGTGTTVVLSISPSLTGTLTTTNARTSGTNAVGLILADPVSGAQTGGFGTILRFSSNGGSAIAEIVGSQGDKTGDASNNQVALRFRTQDSSGTIANRVTIASDGMVGVGTTAPQALLHIAGSTLRLDQTPTSAVNTATHYVTMNFNGTDYKVLLHS